MKYLKKLVILIVLFLPIIVSAKERLNFEWGKYIDTDNEYTSYVIDVVETEEGYLAYSYNYVIYYDKDGNIINTEYLDGYCDYIKYDESTNQFLCLYEDYEYVDGQSNYTIYLILLDEELNILKYNEFKNTSMDYIYPNNSYFLESKDNYIIINLNNFNTIIVKKDLSTFNEYSMDELTADQVKEYWQDYYIIYKLYEENPENSKEYYNIVNNNQYTLLAYYDYKQKISGIEIYDKNYNQILDQQINTTNQIIAELTNDGYYIITENDISDRDECRYENMCTSQIELTKYNFQKEKEYSEELQTLVSYGYEYYYNEGRKITTLKKVNNGLIMLSNYIASPKGKAVQNPDEVIKGILPTITKYYFTYDISTKTDGNGTIKVLSAAKSGEGVTFEITPKEGYVLGVVKVTDKDGNVLTFTDYKFTMPSSDVTIEATFLPENPETSDLIIYIILLFGLTTMFIIYIKNEQKRKYYKNIK